MNMQLFEAAYPNEQDRRTYIDAKLNGAKPSYGHIALATLMKADKTRVVWTTNFDHLIADACAKVYDSTANLTTVALDAPDLGRDVMNGERWPAEIKLHGDFRSRRLKNTNDELRHQDANLRSQLVDACGPQVLLSSGTAAETISSWIHLNRAIDQSSPFPSGLFWLYCGEAKPLQRVNELLLKAAAKGVDCGLVEIEDFDETMRDLVRLSDDLDLTALNAFASDRRVWSSATLPSGNGGFPVIRLNGLEITAPTVCRRITCKIGGYSEVIAAVETAKVDVLATRNKSGVLAFGSDADLRKVFSGYDIEEFDLHSIELRRLKYENQERSLLRQALSHALSRKHSLKLTRRRNTDLLAPSNPADQCWRGLKKLVGALAGTVPGHTELDWSEGIATRMDWADDRLWLLIEPRTVFSGITPENRAAATDFARERTVQRYNRQLNELLTFWSNLLASGDEELRALNVTVGVDAAFSVGSNTVFSRRSRG